MNASYRLHGGRTTFTEVVLPSCDCPLCFSHALVVQASCIVHRRTSFTYSSCDKCDDTIQSCSVHMAFMYTARCRHTCGLRRFDSLYSSFKFQINIMTDVVLNTLICVVGADLTTDDRSYLIHLVNGMAVTDSACFFYPRLLPLVSRTFDSTGCPFYKDILYYKDIKRSFVH